MLRIVSSNLRKSSQSWREDIEDVDWGDESPDKLVNETNLDDYLADNLEEPPELPKQPQDQTVAPSPEISEEHPIDDYRSEIPTINEILTPNATREIIYPTADNMISDAIERREVVGFDYINRHGAYAGWRTVEPHYTFYAYTTGNMILVTWDRDVNDIRAFIVGNIQSNGVRYEDEIFDPKGQIMVGVE